MVIFVFIRVVPRVFRAALGATSKHNGNADRAVRTCLLSD
jgi:hypothetical protein